MTLTQISSNKMLTAYLALAVGLLALGFSAIFVKWANAPGAVTGFYRMSIALFVLAWPFHVRRQQQQARPERVQYGREVAIAAFAGLLFAADLLLWNTGVLLSGATNPTLMGNTAPIWVGLGTVIFFRQRLPLAFWLGLGLALAGAVLILGLDALRDFDLGLGTFYGLISGMFYGGYFLVIQRSRQRLDAITSFWLAALSSSVVLLLAALLLGQPLVGYSWQTWLSFLGIGVIVQAFGQFAFSYALGFLPASLVAPAGLGQPVITAILAVPLLGETISAGQVVGGVAVLAGVWLVHHTRQQQMATTTNQA